MPRIGQTSANRVTTKKAPATKALMPVRGVPGPNGAGGGKTGRMIPMTQVSHPPVLVPPGFTPDPVCVELQGLQRRKVVVIKSRIMQANRLQAVVAGTIGYHSSLAEKDRLKVFKEATGVIEEVCSGSRSHPLEDVIRATRIGIDEFERLEGELKKLVEKAAAKLPAAAWAQLPAQAGFGLASLGTVVGECGDLAGYSNPAKVWKRMGCAPWAFNPSGEEGGGKCLMGSTWRFGKEGKLPAAEWDAFKYSPRRRSVAYVIGENLMKGNFLGKKVKAGVGGEGERVDAEKTDRPPGPYRLRYDESKAAIAAKHPEYPDKRCHLHGMLLATKLLLLNLWCAWHGRPTRG